jgi:hypothetical protein
MDMEYISRHGVSLLLTQARGKIRIADNNGNHIRKPTTEGRNIKTNFIEWMITNEEVSDLAKIFLNENDKEELIKELKKVTVFIKDSKYATRESIKTTTEKLEKFIDFDIYKYTENFYSFEKEINSRIKIRITFKMGDYALAPHLFVLLPFEHPSLIIRNVLGVVKVGEALGSRCFGIWNPEKKDVIEIVKSLSCASDGHRDDLITLLLS